MAKTRHPALLFTRACVIAVLVFFLTPLAMRDASATVADEAKGYRLAGTLAVGDDYLAFLAVPEGGQVIVRAGSIVNGVKVLSVGAHEVKLALHSGVAELMLDGTVKETGAQSSAAIVAKNNDPRNRVYTREVSSDQLSRELSSSSASSAGDAAASSKQLAAQRIASVLDLPAGSTVLGVQGQSVASADVAIKNVQTAFSTGTGVVILDIKTPTGPGRVYLTRPPQP